MIWVAPKNPDQADGRVVADADPRGRRRPRRHGPAYRPRACGGRRLLVRHQPVRPRPAGQAPARAPRSSRWSMRPPSTTATSRPASCSMRPSRSTRAPARTSGAEELRRQQSCSAPRRCALGIEKSRNQMTVRLAQDMGMPLIVEYSKRFGVYDDLLPVLAMSLGAGETTLVKMATAYAVARQRRQAGACDADRSHPGPLGPYHLAARQARVHGLQGREVAGGRPSRRWPTIASRSSTPTPPTR